MPHPREHSPYGIPIFVSHGAQCWAWGIPSQIAIVRGANPLSRSCHMQPGMADSLDTEMELVSSHTISPVGLTHRHAELVSASIMS
jgi:hypothetical protein